MAFEKHVVQAFGAAFRMRAARAQAPEERDALLAQAAAYRPPEACGSPSTTRPTVSRSAARATTCPGAYSQLMDYECELAPA